MRSFQYLVTVTAETQALADEVIQERIVDYQPEYTPYDYQITFTTAGNVKASSGEHGRSAYNSGKKCRCAVCTAANTAYLRAWRAQHKTTGGLV